MPVVVGDAFKGHVLCRAIAVAAIGVLPLLGCAASNGDAEISDVDSDLTAKYDQGRLVPQMGLLLGGNGAPSNAAETANWKKMGLRFSRVEVNPADSSNKADLISKNYIGNASEYDLKILGNNKNGISTVILLGYTPKWNASVAGDTKSKPKDESVWQGYVEAVVKRYSAAPYNVKYFQVWNEAAGPLYASAQATFWHGPPAASNHVYSNAMEDYVSSIHIPAAKIIRSHKAYVVYGGWPCESSNATYEQWLEHKSSVYGQTMLDWTDYLDTHYLAPADMQELWARYQATGKIRGIWQTEVGYSRMIDPNFIARYYFRMASFAVRQNWTSPDQFVAMVYHPSGTESFMLTNRDTDVMNPSGRALVTLLEHTSGKLGYFGNPIKFSSGSSGWALYNDHEIVFQVTSKAGAHTIEVDTLTAPKSFKVGYWDAVSGGEMHTRLTSTKWSGKTLTIHFDAPGSFVDADHVPLDKMGYIVVTPGT